MQKFVRWWSRVLDEAFVLALIYQNLISRLVLT
jgi:hypothetical protein